MTNHSHMKRSPLRKMSTNKARETAKYWPLRRKFIDDHPFCEFPATSIPDLNNESAFYTSGCVRRTSSVHHMKGQHWKIMNDTRWWLATCTEHHAWIEDHKNEARKRGLILYQ